MQLAKLDNQTWDGRRNNVSERRFVKSLDSLENN